ncbi:hypothetical protein [Sporomusa sp. KB1]|jgi:hypothetical protein|uniref:hypothetical protein n=1 Tax=Sporomusa sp. KB1 TaxID=943346 RepID=UPI0011AD60D9|nr:hypothetical protein [Sporomusa sp. KB1]TWH47990.1 hypothetical protein Salpa_4119 [Sporomusa sp. KB1]
MSEIEILNSVDPVGNIILCNDKVYRGINAGYEEEYAQIYNKCKVNGLLGNFIIPTIIADDFTLEPYQLIFEHELVKPYIYPFEWTLLMHCDAAYTVLDLVVKLDEIGLGLKDGHRFNIAFHKGRFFWIDFGSIISYKTTHWMIEEFIDSFIHSIICIDQGIFYKKDIYECLTEAQKEKYALARSTIINYGMAGDISNAVTLLYDWIKIYEHNIKILPYNHVTSTAVLDGLIAFIKTANIDRVLVIDGNAADISLSLNKYGNSVTVFNADAQYIDSLYFQIRRKITNISPVFIDVTLPDKLNEGLKWPKAEKRFAAEMAIIVNPPGSQCNLEFNKLIQSLKLFSVKYVAIEVEYPYTTKTISAIEQSVEIVAVIQDKCNDATCLIIVKV